MTDNDRKAYHSILVDNLEILRQSRPMASKALQTESLGRDTFQAGTFWDLLWRSAKYFLASNMRVIFWFTLPPDQIFITDSKVWLHEGAVIS